LKFNDEKTSADMKRKFIHIIYNIVVYSFPVLLLFLFLVGLQLRKMEKDKENTITRLHNTNVVIEAVLNELISIKKELGNVNDSLVKSTIVVPQVSEIPKSVPDNVSEEGLVELRKNVLKRVAKLENDTVDYYNKPFVIKQPTGRYYTIIISYSELGYAIIQREHLKSVGFKNVKILVVGKLYAISIEDAVEMSDSRLRLAIEKWNENFKPKSDACIIKF